MTEPLDFDRLQRLMWSFAAHRVVTTAARTGVLRRLAEQPDTPAGAAHALGLDADATGKVVRALHALGLLVHDGPRYRPAPALEPLFREGDDDILPMLEHWHRMYESWGGNLEGWVRGDTWQRAHRTPEDIQVFGEAMRAVGGQIAKRIAAALDLDDAQRLLDVGGGFGQFARAMCREAPDLHAIVLDRPEVAQAGRTEIADSDLEGRLEFVGGDYHTTDFGTGFDIVLLANVLHQESARDAARLIRRAAAALAPGGVVAVVDFQIDEHRREHVLGTLFAINMRDFGDTWTEPDIRGWMQAAGLGHVERVDIGSDRWLLTGRASRLTRAHR